MTIQRLTLYSEVYLASILYSKYTYASILYSEVYLC